jgi:hypothetical protein
MAPPCAITRQTQYNKVVFGEIGFHKHYIIIVMPLQAQVRKVRYFSNLYRKFRHVVLPSGGITLKNRRFASRLYLAKHRKK